MEKNQIITGNCVDVLRGDVVPDKSVDLVLTDPPYKFESHGRGLAGHRTYLNVEMKKIGTDLNTDIYGSGEFIENLIRLCKKPNIVLFCNKAQIPEILEQAKRYNLNFDILVLCKTAPSPLTNNQRLPDKEYAIHLHKQAPVRGDYHTKHTFWVAPNFKDTKINHPTVKPLNVIEDIIRNLTDEGDTVLDCYLGSGTTAVACKKLKRNFIGIEINPEYVEIAKNRLKELEIIEQQRLF